ncbi:hypothetical protein V6N13_020989 [Hibiscus sabdariffa]|uniref:Uncharacterized protein n=2 Tax=Hibiscus sabdariffa TaxID=183260 RepID=A0ABR2EV66_9ROSI
MLSKATVNRQQVSFQLCRLGLLIHFRSWVDLARFLFSCFSAGTWHSPVASPGFFKLLLTALESAGYKGPEHRPQQKRRASLHMDDRENYRSKWNLF